MAKDERRIAMYQRIVVPVDGSDLAELAIPHAVELAMVTGADLHLVRVVDIVSGQPFGAYVALEATGYAEALNAEAIESMDYLGMLQKRLSARGLSVTTETRRGPAAHELSQCAEPGDLIVMATHGRGGVRRWLIGSVAEEVLRHSPVPVLLVRADQNAAFEKQTLASVGAGSALEC
jgi:nucleotide-binding universal stress UspA family protein